MAKLRLTPQEVEDALRMYSILEMFEHSDAYQLFIVPLQKEIDGMKHSYKMKSLQAIAEHRGLYDGLRYPFQLMDSIRRRGEAAREASRRMVEIENLERKIEDNPDNIDLDPELI